MTVSKNSKMMGLLNHRLRLTLLDTRVMTGQMLAFDKHMNLVLADCEEFRAIKAKESDAKGKTRQIKRTLGLVILRGESVISISVDGPPPASASAASRQAKAAALASGPGVGRPAGRGMPLAPPGAAPPGLAGPVRGIGGPALGMMQPRGPAAISAAPVSFMRPPPQPPVPGMRGMGPPPGFRPPPPGMAPPPGFRPPPPPGMGPPPGFRPPRPGSRPPPPPGQ
ncbi:Small nuclear ribonucleoprotein-associated protein B [Coemansia sp. RSA 2599]|nr:Small nuclear ribonucleoprotein-associated protein B [Coemansia sp. RSA 2598]KAJ1827838.1 Small nuclear ribonucleoprotein-associated protein B [Coemansia sp. RSA 2599]